MSLKQKSFLRQLPMVAILTITLQACSLPDSPESGMGTFTDDRGSTYTGEFLNSKPNGHGKEVLVGGTVLEGEFKDGMIVSGTSTQSNGAKFIGTFSGNAPDTGTMIFQDSSLKGEFYHQSIDDPSYDTALYLNGVYTLSYKGTSCSITFKNVPLSGDFYSKAENSCP